MTAYIAYHNTDEHGHLPGVNNRISIERFLNNRLTAGSHLVNINSKKCLEDAKGHDLFLIAGVGNGSGKPKRYFLWQMMRVNDIRFEEENSQYVYDGDSVILPHAPELDGDDFGAFKKKRMANFSLGLTRVEHPYLATLYRYFSEEE